MLVDVVSAEPLADYKLRLSFEDGLVGILDLEPYLSFRGVFAPLRDRAYFRSVTVNKELGTIAWPNGADFDPDVLYSLVSGKPVPVVL